MYTTARLHMVDGQIRTDNVHQPALLEALKAVPRELFVPDHQNHLAYTDTSIPLEHGRALMEPSSLAKLVQALDITPSCRVLVVACGTGYGAAVLSRMAHAVTALEEFPDLLNAARRTSESLGYANIQYVQGKVTLGHLETSPYDAILIDGGIEDTPPSALLDQLSPDGRLGAVLRPSSGPEQATIWFKNGNAVSRRVVDEAQATTLPEFQRKKEFIF